MLLLYNLLIRILSGLYRLAALYQPKAKLFVEGRRSEMARLRSMFPSSDQRPLVWVHCASLGEFEQARPVIEYLKSHSNTRILLTFFSPSGFEVRKNYELADVVTYLPWDTRSNAAFFVEVIKPSLVIFVKYEFWHHYATAIRKAGIPLISISSIFRDDQIYFQFYGGFFRNILRQFSWFFVQNDISIQLLLKIGINQVTKAGDTRFDRVREITKQGRKIPFIDRFKGTHKLLVAGSTWPQDMEVINPLIQEYKSKVKFIVAPHEVNDVVLFDLEKGIHARTVRYSALTDANAADAEVLIIDNVGMLSALYGYGEFAFVGGGFAQGLHNILEASSYGIPVFFGNKAYQKFNEAVELIKRGGAFDVGDYTSLRQQFAQLLDNADLYQLACTVAQQYTDEHLGATKVITSHLERYLAAWKAS